MHFVQKEFLVAVGEIALGLAVIDFKGRVDAHLVSVFFVGSVGDELEDDFLWKFLFEFDLEGADAWAGAIEGSVDVVLWVDMAEDDFVSESYVFASFFGDDSFELFLFCFGAGFGLCFLGFDLLWVHFIIDFKGTGGEYFKEGLAVVVDIDAVVGAGGEEVVFVVDLEVEVGIGVSEWMGVYDLLVRKVLAFSYERILITCP